MTGTDPDRPNREPDAPRGLPPYTSAHVVDALASAPDVAVLDLEVRDVNGTLLVSGTVESADQREAALVVARRAAQPCEVRDGISVVVLHDPPDAEQLP